MPVTVFDVPAFPVPAALIALTVKDHVPAVNPVTVHVTAPVVVQVLVVSDTAFTV
jgi:hypothetical protein